MTTSHRRWHRSIALAVVLCGLAAAPLAAQETKKSVQFGTSQAETGVFGLKAKGKKFLYVFDRSGSMKGAPLAAAKRELLASLDDLEGVHQFQIIFYNEKPSVVTSPGGGQPRLLFGSSSDKGIASDFVERVSATGGSGHLDALKIALRLKPDVIFFLTDAGEPSMTDEELAEVRKRNDGVGASIYAIEFGVGPQDKKTTTFLQAIAEQNRGEHAYVDVTELRDKKK